jgi:hypothetical protein
MKRKIEFDRQKPDSDEILARRDFDALLKQAQQQPGKVRPLFWKTGSFYASISVVAAVFVAVVLIVKKDIISEKQDQTIADQAKSQADTLQKNAQYFTQLTAHPEYLSEQISADQGGTIHIGSIKIEIPAHALIDSAENEVTGDVAIQYQLLNTPVDLFLNNIPMSSASGTSSWAYASSEIIQVSAWKNGQQLSIQSGRDVLVEMPVMTGYSAYKLEKENWAVLTPVSETGQSADQFAEDEIPSAIRTNYERLLQQRDAALQAALSSISIPILPAEPQRSDRKKYRFTVDFKKAEFPEMGDYEKVVFEVDESAQKFDSELYKVEWEDVKLQRTDQLGFYQLILRKGIRTVRLFVRPAMDESTYQKAMQIYNEAVSNRNARLKSQDSLKNSIASRYQARLSDLVSKQHTQTKDQGKLRFRLRHWGIIGLLRQIVYPTEVKTRLQLNDEKGKPLTIDKIQHIERRINTLFSWTENPIEGFGYNPATENQIWVVSKGVVYTSNEAQFRTATQSQAKALNLMPVPPYALASASAFRRYVGY